MSCKPFQNSLEAFSLGLLSPKEEARIKQHVQSCPKCAQILARHEQAGRLIEKAFDQNPPAYLRSKVMANLKDLKKKKPSWLYWAAPGLVAAAALVLVIKIEPGRMAKQQVLETVQLEQEMTAPVSPAPQAPTSLDVRKDDAPGLGSAFSETKARRSKQRSLGQGGAASMAKAAPYAPRPSASAPQAPSRSEKPLNSLPGAAQETQNLSTEPSDEEAVTMAFAPAQKPEVLEKSQKRSMARAMSQPRTAGFSSDKAEPSAGAPFIAQSVSDSSLALSGEAQTHPVETVKDKKAPAAHLSLVEIQGALNRAQVLEVLHASEPWLAEKIQETHEAKTIRAKLSLDPQGKVQQAEWVGEGFQSASVNRDILHWLKSLKFNPPADSRPALMLVQISAMP